MIGIAKFGKDPDEHLADDGDQNPIHGNLEPEPDNWDVYWSRLFASTERPLTSILFGFRRRFELSGDLL